ncbi:MAG TPA: c-type cytochrome [Armatimonadota bacterium]|nr:c-type cytochrome [Armatimonadota bacterium]
MGYWKMWGIGVLLAILCSSCGPRMDHEPSIKAYHQEVPPMPQGTVPTTRRLQTNTLEQSKLAKNPLPSSPVNLALGEQYYGNYCAFCHGVLGRGDGPVATVLTAEVADLTAPAVQKLNDGQLYYRMLHGVGHDPVMDQTVLPDRRWEVVLYVRSLSGK